MKDYYNLQLYGYHEDDEFHFHYGSEEFQQLHDKLENIKPYVTKVIEQVNENLNKFPSSFWSPYPRIIESTGRFVTGPDVDFITTLFLSVGPEEAEKFIKNTVMYENGKNADKKYVMCYRRAIPSEEPLYDNFWTYPDSREAFTGLKAEQHEESDIRLHSVIKVTSLAKLEEHGIVSTKRSGTDGEIAIDPNKKFSGILFQYKNFNEMFSLIRYLENGGITRTELLDRAKIDYLERSKKQGLPIFEENFLDEQLDAICGETTRSGFDEMSKNIREIYRQYELGDDEISDDQIEGGIGWDDDDW